ncbi:MAG: glycoside hydrolase family 99-like domain-containing protein [Planctomycetota bacterium]
MDTLTKKADDMSCLRLTRRSLLWGLALLALAGEVEGQEMEQSSARPITVACYYFPNWHTDPEKGKTTSEWGRLKVAYPRFDEHQQPKTPAWGYENEADPQAMARKIAAAADHGIDVFLFDYYCNDRVSDYLESALSKGYIRAANNDRVKFALMWANHDLAGAKGEVSRQTFDRLAEHVVRDYMTHPSHWRIDGKPYFSIYQLGTLVRGLGGVEQTRQALDHFRALAKQAGLPGVHINAVDWGMKPDREPRQLVQALGVDSVTSYVWVHWVRLKDFPRTDYDYVLAQYLKHWEQNRQAYGAPYFPNVTMGWDSTPRIPANQPHDGRGYPNTPVMSGNTPERFRRALELVRSRVLEQADGPRVVTINAWNEWGEGSYLEPDTVNGMAYLEAIKTVFPPKLASDRKGDR